MSNQMMFGVSSPHTVELPKWLFIPNCMFRPVGGCMSYLGDTSIFSANPGQNFPWLREVYQSTTPANGDALETVFEIQGGRYIFIAYSRYQNNLGKIDWYLNNNLIVSGQDWYRAASSHASQTSVEFTMPIGQNRLKAVINGKNASSSSYYFLLAGILIIPRYIYLEV